MESTWINPYVLVGLEKKTKDKPDVSDIVSATLQHYGYTIETVSQRIRTKRIVQCRQMAWLVIKDYFPKMSLNSMASIFGDYDHTTIIYSMKTIKDIMDTDPDVRAIYERVKYKIQGANAYENIEEILEGISRA